MDPDNARSILVLGLSALAAVASLAGLFSLIRHRRKARVAAEARDGQEPLPFMRVETLLTPSERALYSALRPAAVAQGADVFARVPLGDVVLVRKGAPDYEARSASIAACRIGFLLCDRERLVPVLALQIDGDRARGRQHDAKFLGEALASVGVPLARVQARSSYDPDVIAALVRDEITQAASAARPASEPAPIDGADAPDELPPRRQPRAGWQVPAFSASWLEGAQALAREPQAELGLNEGEQAAGDEPLAEGTAGWAVDAGSAAGDGEVPGGGLESVTGAAGPVAVDEPAAGEALAASDSGAADLAEAGPQLEDAPAGPQCPACGSALVEMQDLETGVVVLACSRYPDCPHVQAR